MEQQRIISVQRHLVESQHVHPQATGELTGLLWDLTLAFKLISAAVNKAGLTDVLGMAGSTNVHGEDVTRMDRYAQEVIVRMMDHGGHLCAMASEEEEEIIPLTRGDGRYVLCFDPLDGSSNIGVNVSVGTIFSIYRRVSPGGGPGHLEDVLQPGRELVAAGYAVYGSSTMLVYSTGAGVHGFTLDPGLGEFLLSHPNLRIPRRGSIYSVNEGNQAWWDDATRRYVEHLKSPEQGPYKSRYIGSMIADVHRTLLTGGVFLYPRTYKKDKVRGEAKLRLLYEALPMAFLVEQAGGRALAGSQPLMEVIPHTLHQRVEVAMGSPADVDDYASFIQGAR